MRHLIRACVASAAAIALAATAACGASAGTGATENSATIKVGVVADITGPGSAAFKSADTGVRAYFNRINAAGGVNGKKLEVVVADTTSTPSGALAATQQLWQNDHVFAIFPSSAVFDGVVSYTKKNNIPVIAALVVGTVWSDRQYTNVFLANGVSNPDYVNLAEGVYMKSQGATNCGAISFNSTNGTSAATNFAASCRDAGLNVGYLNTQLPPGSTDVGPVALAMKNAHVDAAELVISPESAFALIAALRQQGVNMKSVMLTTGYGGDLLASPASVQAAQGLDFRTTGAPAEADSAAVKQRTADMATVGVTGPPRFAEGNGYLMASALVAGLKAAGPNPTQDSFMKAMSGIKDFDADGLLAPMKVNFRDYTPATSCVWVSRLAGNAFHPMPGTPTCAATKKAK
ncbi:ABC transporter substrate-binding protein [Amycolatopsis sp. GM8]|uniref:ABC transporter substrate-binding protein n=1 Tax=Amycolatopsis sp. GM8 TaxID=2896530 RepID=UPI002104C038|nr:ABC transporter substrate-binding protein [Amycolatopsis sp. GM8]